MAANDYYANSHPGQSNDRNDAPLPPVPGNHTQHSVSPVSSPFDDRPYPTHTASSGALGGYPIDTSYSNTSYQPPTQYSSTAHINDPYARQPDPFADQNAIPLQTQPKMDGSSPTRYNGDPEYYGMGVEPKRRKSKKKKGWFSGRVTWVVYLLTAVQVGVFVGELIKNGMLLQYKHIWRRRHRLTAYRHLDRQPHPNQAKLQHHDRSFTLRFDQHGRALHTLHAQHQENYRSRWWARPSMAMPEYHHPYR